MLSDITSGASRQTVNSALRKLESERIVYLEIFEGRKKKVYLTPKGRQFAKDTVFRVIEAENEIFASWSDEEKSIYIDLIQLSDHFDYKILLRFTFPSMVMTVFTSLYSVVDGFFVSNFVG